MLQYAFGMRRRGVTSWSAALGRLVLLGGCGATAPRRDPATVARLIAEAHAICGSLAFRSDELAKHSLGAAGQHLQRIVNELGPAAAYLPAGRALNEAHAKRRALTSEMDKASNAYNAHMMTALDARFRRVQAQIHDDLRSLGFGRCLTPLPPPSKIRAH